MPRPMLRSSLRPLLRPPTTDRQTRLPSLTGMRFAAAFMVLVCHASTSMLPRLGPEHAERYQRFADASGAVGVSFFFVLSGFILTWVARPAQDTRARFWRRRLVKIFPNHLATWAAGLLLMLAAGVTLTSLGALPMLFLVQSWVPSQQAILNYGSNAPSWSLACELLFYLCFPWLFAAARRIRPERLWHWVGGLTLAIVAVPVFAQLLPTEPRTAHGADAWLPVWFTYYFPGTRLLDFALGILMALVVLNKRWIGLRMAPALLLTAAAFVGGAYLPGVFGSVAPTALPLALLIAATATADVNGTRTGCGGRVASWFGEISYAFYMVHFLVVCYGPIGAAHLENWMKPLTVTEALRDLALTFLISLAAAWLLYVLVEAPAMRRWSRPAPAATPAPAEPPGSGPPGSETPEGERAPVPS